MSITVKPFQISPVNFSCGDVLLSPVDNRQFEVTDYVRGVVTLRELTAEEKNKLQFCDGTVVFFEEGDFRHSGDAEPSGSTIASQILGEFDDSDPEDYYGSNYVAGLS